MHKSCFVLQADNVSLFGIYGRLSNLDLERFQFLLPGFIQKVACIFDRDYLHFLSIRGIRSCRDNSVPRRASSNAESLLNTRNTAPTRLNTQIEVGPEEMPKV